MDHVAIMSKPRKLIQKILSGEKTIESRWYKNRYPPWNRIKPGDIVYFKDSGEPVTVKADVEKVLQFDNLNPEKIKYIIEKYGDKIAIRNRDERSEYYSTRNYCILIFLKNAYSIKPFNIDKTGFGISSAWLCAGDINKIKV